MQKKNPFIYLSKNRSSRLSTVFFYKNPFFFGKKLILYVSKMRMALHCTIHSLYYYLIYIYMARVYMALLKK